MEIANLVPEMEVYYRHIKNKIGKGVYKGLVTKSNGQSSEGANRIVQITKANGVKTNRQVPAYTPLFSSEQDLLDYENKIKIENEIKIKQEEEFNTKLDEIYNYVESNIKSIKELINTRLEDINFEEPFLKIIEKKISEKLNKNVLIIGEYTAEELLDEVYKDDSYGNIFSEFYQQWEELVEEKVVDIIAGNINKIVGDINIESISYHDIYKQICECREWDTIYPGSVINRVDLSNLNID